jgi:hypothetical protein
MPAAVPSEAMAPRVRVLVPRVSAAMGGVSRTLSGPMGVPAGVRASPVPVADLCPSSAPPGLAARSAVPLVSGVGVSFERSGPAAGSDGSAAGLVPWWRGRELAGFVVAVLVALALAGCGGSSGQGGATSAAASADPAGKDALVGAVKALQGMSYAYTMKIDGGTVTGMVDPAGKRQARLDSVASGVKFSLEGIVLGGGERYFRTSIPTTGVSAKKWYRFDRTKVTRTEIIGLFETVDPTSSQDFVARVGQARLEDRGKITGTYDLTRGGDLGLADQAGLAALGDRAKATPFVVMLDAQGRLASVRVTVPAYAGGPERTLAVDYRDQGKPVQVTVPKAAEVAPANAAVYNLLNN